MRDCNDKKHEKMHEMKAEKMHEMKEENMHEMKDEKHKMDDREEEMWQRLYPDSYMCIHMAMEQHCAKMEKEKGKNHIPDREEFEKMVDDVLEDIEDDMKFMDECEGEDKDDEDNEDRYEEYTEDKDEEDEEDEEDEMSRFMPPYGGRRRRRRRLNRDLLGLLLLGQLHGRRRPYPPYYPPRPYPPPYTPYGGPYPGY